MAGERDVTEGRKPGENAAPSISLTRPVSPKPRRQWNSSFKFKRDLRGAAPESTSPGKLGRCIRPSSCEACDSANSPAKRRCYEVNSCCRALILQILQSWLVMPCINLHRHSKLHPLTKCCIKLQTPPMPFKWSQWVRHSTHEPWSPSIPFCSCRTRRSWHTLYHQPNRWLGSTSLSCPRSISQISMTLSIAMPTDCWVNLIQPWSAEITQHHAS